MSSQAPALAPHSRFGVDIWAGPLPDHRLVNEEFKANAARVIDLLTTAFHGEAYKPLIAVIASDESEAYAFDPDLDDPKVVAAMLIRVYSYFCINNKVEADVAVDILLDALQEVLRLKHEH